MKWIFRLFAQTDARVDEKASESDVEMWWRESVVSACEDAACDVAAARRLRLIDNDEARRRLRAIRDFGG